VVVTDAGRSAAAAAPAVHPVLAPDGLAEAEHARPSPVRSAAHDEKAFKGG